MHFGIFTRLGLASAQYSSYGRRKNEWLLFLTSTEYTARRIAIPGVELVETRINNRLATSNSFNSEILSLIRLVDREDIFPELSNTL